MSFNINEIITGDFEKEYLERANQIDVQLHHVIDVFEAMKDTSAEPVKGVTLAVRQDLRKRFYASCLHKVYSALMRAQNDLVDAFGTAFLAASSVSLLDETSGSVFGGLKDALRTGEVFDKRPFVPSRSRPLCRTAMTVDAQLAAARRAVAVAKEEVTRKLKESADRLPSQYVDEFKTSLNRSHDTRISLVDLLVFEDYEKYVEFLRGKVSKRLRAARPDTSQFKWSDELTQVQTARVPYEASDLRVRQLVQRQSEERQRTSAQASNAPSGPRQREEKVKGFFAITLDEDLLHENVKTRLRGEYNASFRMNDDEGTEKFFVFCVPPIQGGDSSTQAEGEYNASVEEFKYVSRYVVTLQNLRKELDTSGAVDYAIDDRLTKLAEALIKLKEAKGWWEMKDKVVSYCIQTLLYSAKDKTSSRDVVEYMLQDDRYKRMAQPTNFMLLGPSGIGKTQSASYLGSIIAALGVVPGMDPNEEPPVVGAETFGTGFAGQAATRTRSVLQNALGKMLIVDEAYQIANGEYAQDIIDGLTNYMDRYKGLQCVVMCGYEKEMNQLIEKNSGLGRRFSDRVRYERYTNDEILTIFEDGLRNFGLTMENQARLGMEYMLKKAYSPKPSCKQDEEDEKDDDRNWAYFMQLAHCMMHSNKEDAPCEKATWGRPKTQHDPMKEKEDQLRELFARHADSMKKIATCVNNVVMEKKFSSIFGSDDVISDIRIDKDILRDALYAHAANQVGLSQQVSDIKSKRHGFGSLPLYTELKFVVTSELKKVDPPRFMLGSEPQKSAATGDTGSIKKRRSR